MGKYGANGIDLDIEGAAGGSTTAASNLVAFAKKLGELNPKMIITQPVYGYPQITAENTMVNQGFTKNGESTGLINSIGIMVYNGVGSLQYVKDYANGTAQWDGFPITVNVPTQAIIAGINGNAGSSTIMQLAKDIVAQDLGGIMVWLSSVWDGTRNKLAFTYGGGAMDTTKTNTTTGSAWQQAMEYMMPNVTTTTTTTSTSTSTTTTTTTGGPVSECVWHSASNSLNLTAYNNVSLAKVGDDNSAMLYSLSPCNNSINCNGKYVNSELFDLNNMKCDQYLSMWEGGSTIPKYDATDKIWQFIYFNGQQCNGLDSTLEVYWACDPKQVKPEIVSARQLAECAHAIHINASSACN